MIKELSINNVKGQELSEYYWCIIYENMKPYVDFMQALPELQKKYKLFVLTDELIEIHKQKLICLGLDNI